MSSDVPEGRVIKLGSHLLVTTGAHDLVALCCHDPAKESCVEAHALFYEQRVPWLPVPDYPTEGKQIETLEISSHKNRVGDNVKTFTLILRELRDWAIEEALQQAQGSPLRASKLLGCSRKTVQNWLRDHNR